MDIVQCWSGGKDSTLSAYLHLKQGDNVTLVCCIPYFKDDIPLLPKSQLDFLYEKKYYFEKLGANVVFLRGMSYWDYCMRSITRGANVGKLVGYPLFMKGKCGFMRECKKIPVDKFLNTLPNHIITDISYTVDEVRGDLLNNQMSLLRDFGLSQKDVFKSCLSLGLLSPLYEKKKRDGCLLCPHGSCSERYKLFEDYPQTFDILYQLQANIKESRPNIYPLRKKHYFIEDEYFVSPNGSKISLFGKTIN